MTGAGTVRYRLWCCRLCNAFCVRACRHGCGLWTRWRAQHSRNRVVMLVTRRSQPGCEGLVLWRAVATGCVHRCLRVRHCVSWRATNSPGGEAGLSRLES